MPYQPEPVALKKGGIVKVKLLQRLERKNQR